MYIVIKQIDILALAETHLYKDDVLNINGYTWFGLNRKIIHINARKGSGGVGFLIRNDLLENYDVTILNKEHEGILWLKLQHKYFDYTLLPCVCYLPPENSSRQFNVDSF